MLFLFVFVDNLIAHSAFGRVTIALDCVGHCLGSRYNFLAVGTLEIVDWWLVSFAIQQLFFSAKYILVLSCESTLLFNFFRVYLLQFGLSASPNSSTLVFSL